MSQALSSNTHLNSNFWDDQNFSIPTHDEPQEDGHNKISQGNGKWLRIKNKTA